MTTNAVHFQDWVDREVWGLVRSRKMEDEEREDQHCFCTVVWLTWNFSLQMRNEVRRLTINTLNSEVWKSGNPYYVRMALMLGFAGGAVCLGRGWVTMWKPWNGNLNELALGRRQGFSLWAFKLHFVTQPRENKNATRNIGEGTFVPGWGLTGCPPGSLPSPRL